MAAKASSYYDLPYDELYDAEIVVIALAVGVSGGPDAPNHQDEIGFFEGRLVSYSTPEREETEIDLKVPVDLSTYRSWSASIPDFFETPSQDAGIAALRVGRFDEATYSCRVAILDEAQTLTSTLLLALLSAGLSGEKEVLVTLSGRVGEPPEGGLVAHYAWAECGVEAAEFGEGLDAREHEPPMAQFQAVVPNIKVDARAIARQLTVSPDGIGEG